MLLLSLMPHVVEIREHLVDELGRQVVAILEPELMSLLEGVGWNPLLRIQLIWMLVWQPHHKTTRVLHEVAKLCVLFGMAEMLQ